MGQQTQKFISTVGAENQGRTLRGKIPMAMVTALGANAGDVIEFEVTGKFITGGHVLRGRNAQIAQNNRVNAIAKPKATSAKASKPAPKAQAKPTLSKNKPSLAKVPRPAVAQKAAAPKRKTAVAYEKPTLAKKKPTLKRK